MIRPDRIAALYALQAADPGLFHFDAVHDALDELIPGAVFRTRPEFFYRGGLPLPPIRVEVRAAPRGFWQWLVGHRKALGYGTHPMSYDLAYIRALESALCNPERESFHDPR